VLIAFIENKVENLLSLDIPVDIRGPNVPCSLLIFLIILLEAGNNDQFLKGIVEVLLVVMEG
jgi:hypothetical protein